MKSFKLKTLSVAVLLAAGTNAHAESIDLFTTDQATITSTITGGSFNGLITTPNLTPAAAATSTVTTAGTDIVGGERDISVQAIANYVTATGESTAGVSGSTFNFNNDTGVAGIAQIQWDGTDGDATAGDTTSLGGIDTNGLGGFDLTAGGTLNAFQVVTLNADADWQFAITIFEADGDINNTNNAWVKVTFDVTEVDPLGPAHISYIDFAGFGLPGQITALGSPCGAPAASLPAGVASVECSAGDLPGSIGTNGVDLTNIGAIVADFNTGDAKAVSVDLTLAQITSTNVPEPSSLALLGLGLFAAGFVGRSKKTA